MPPTGPNEALGYNGTAGGGRRPLPLPPVPMGEENLGYKSEEGAESGELKKAMKLNFHLSTAHKLDRSSNCRRRRRRRRFQSGTSSSRRRTRHCPTRRRPSTSSRSGRSSSRWPRCWSRLSWCSCRRRWPRGHSSSSLRRPTQSM